MDFSKIKCDTPDKCRFTVGLSSTTCMYFPPQYNRSGRNMNPDGNITSGYGECTSCGKRFSVITQFGKTEIKEIK